MEHSLHVCHATLLYKNQLQKAIDGRSAWTFPLQSCPSFKKSPTKVTGPRSEAKTNMPQALGSGHQINGMLKYFSFLKT